MFRLGFVSFEFVPAQGSAGGLLLAWDDSIEIKIVLTSCWFINCLVYMMDFPQPWQISFVYGSAVPHLRPSFLSSLQEVGQSFHGAWVLIGDFNMVLNSDDKRGGRPVPGPSRSVFRSFVDLFELIDLGFMGPPFTWSNK